MTSTESTPAEFDGYRPCCLLFDLKGDIHGMLPLDAWPRLMAWFSDPLPMPPLLFTDDMGQRIMVARGAVSSIVRRDLDAALALQARQNDEEGAPEWKERDG